ncbi:MAG: EpsG family protein [Cellulosilyticaceae bacterium]
MVYIIIFLFFAGIAIIKKKPKDSKDIVSLLFASILMLMTGLRYGVGSDYFAYYWHYKMNPTTIIDAITYDAHMDIGYRVLASIFKNNDVSFEIFAGIIGVVVLIIVIKTTKMNSKNVLLSLIMFYGIYYHIYVNSAIRQGIALSVFFLAFYRYYKKKSIFKYVLCIIIGALFHKSVLITLLIPLCSLKVLKLINNKFITIGMTLTCIAAGLIGIDIVFVKILELMGISLNYGRSDIHILAVLLRLINLTIVVFLYNQRKKSISEWDKKQIAIYIIGMNIYFLVCRIPMMSRLIEYFGIIEIIIIPNLICASHITINKFCYKIGILLLVGIILVKDLISFIDQGDYYNKNVLEYPYTSIFNKEEIVKYRYILPQYMP